MVLVIDIGNTHAKFGLYDGASITADWRAVTDHGRTADEWGALLNSFLALNGHQMGDIGDCILSSVVPMATDAVASMLEKYFDIVPLIVGSDIDIGLPIEYENRKEVGADRLANAVAGFQRYGAPCIVIDFGTSTNFDIVSPEGAYIGGVLAPGLELSAEALFSRAAKLFKVEFQFPPAVIGRSTVTAMQSGLLWGYVSLIEGVTRRIQEELAVPAYVVATGGLAGLLAPRTDVIDAVDQQLTIEGLAYIWNRNRAHRT